MKKRLSRPISLALAVVIVLSSFLGYLTPIPTYANAVLEITALANGNFDFWGEVHPEFWGGSTTSVPGGSVQKSEDAKFGNYALNLTRTQSGHQRYSTSPYALRADVEYTITYWVKGKGEIRNAFYRDGNYSGYSGYESIDSDDWQKIEYTFSYGKDVSDAQLIFSIRNTDASRNHLTIDGVRITSDAQVTQVSPVVAMPAPGVVEEGTEVTLTTLTENTKIYYTMDGSEPSNSSLLYNAPIVIHEDMTLKAIAICDLGELSPSAVSLLEYRLPRLFTLGEARDTSVGENITVRGIVTSILGNGQNIHIQDETAGIVVRLSNRSFSQGLVLGDEVEVSGVRGDFNDVKQINVSNASDFVVKSQSNPYPEPKGVSPEEFSEAFKAQVIRVDFLEVVDFPSAAGAGYNVPMRDFKGNDVLIRVENTVGIEQSVFEVGSFFHVEGILGYHRGYQVMLAVPDALESVDVNNMVAEITANPSPGLVAAGTSVTLSTATEGASIYYTVDGSYPTEDSFKYENPIVINENTVVSVIAVKDGMVNRPVTRFDYRTPTAVEGSYTVSTFKQLEEGSKAEVVGVMIGRDQNNFYIQNGYEGIRVIGSTDYEVGKKISVEGTLMNEGGEKVMRHLQGDKIELLSDVLEITVPSISLAELEMVKNIQSVDEVLESYTDNRQIIRVRGRIAGEANNQFGVSLIDQKRSIDGFEAQPHMRMALSQGYRSIFSPHVENSPEVLGRMVIAVGGAQNYNGRPGIRDVSGWDSATDSPVSRPYGIAFDYEGSMVTMRYPGEVIEIREKGFVIKDEEGSVFVSTLSTENFHASSVQLGDWYQITGVVGYENHEAVIYLLNKDGLQFAVGPGQQDPRVPLVLDEKPGDFTTTYEKTPLISFRVERSSMEEAADVNWDGIRMFISDGTFQSVQTVTINEDGLEETTQSYQRKEWEVTPHVDSSTGRVTYQVPSDQPFEKGTYDVRLFIPDVEGRSNQLRWFFHVKDEAVAYQFFYGVPHSHTAYSDGAGTPTQAYNHAIQNGLDFLILTDHSNWYDGVAENNFEFNAQANEYREAKNPVTGEKSEWWKTRLEAESINEANDHFLAIRGFEHTSSIWGHANTINSDTYVEAKRQMVPLREYYEWAADVSQRPGANVFNMFNHPNWPDDSFADLAYVPDMDRYFNGIEVANGAPPYSYSRSEGHYWKALDNGWRVGAMNAQDNHAMNWGDPDTLTVVLSESLEIEDFISAMNSRRMYSTETRSLELTYKANGYWMGSVIDIEQGDDIQFEIRAEDKGVPIERLQLITNGGTIIDEKVFEGGTHLAVWEPKLKASGGSEWFVVKVIHEQGLWGTSSPIFASPGEYDLKITGVQANPNPVLPGNDVLLTSTVANMGVRHIDENVEVSFYLNDPRNPAMKIGSASYSDRMISGAVIELGMTWQVPADLKPGSHRIFAVMNTIEGITTVTETSMGLTVTPRIDKHVMIDASHGNDEAPGGITNFINFLRFHGYDVTVNETRPMTSALLEGVDVLVINTPDNASNRYTSEEIAVINNWTRSGGSVIFGNKSNFRHNPALLNNVLEGMGTTVRFNNDGVNEDNPSLRGMADMPWSVNAYNVPDTEVAQNVRAVRIFSGGSLIAVDSQGKVGPLTDSDDGKVRILLRGNETSFNTSVASGGYTYNRQGEKKGADIPIIAIETLDQGHVVTAGKYFYSNFEIGNDVSNTAFTLQVVDYLAGVDRVVSIADAKKMNPGDMVTVRGIVTAPTNHFFDSIYIQDETSGINIYGNQSRDNLPVGTEVMITGRVGSFEGEVQLSYDNDRQQVMLLDSTTPIVPKEVSTVEAMSEEYRGMLVTTRGEIVEYNEAETYFVVEDDFGRARVHVDGYVGASMNRFSMGDYVQVTGNASHGSAGPRIRVRFFNDLQLASPIEHVESTINDERNLIEVTLNKLLKPQEEAVVIIQVFNKEGKPYIIVYDEISENGLLKFSFNESLAEDDYYKVYVWENLDSMKPIFNVKRFEVK